MKTDLVVRNGWIVTSSSVFFGGLAIENGRIVAIGPISTLPDARRVIDATERLIMPGLIDPHVHMTSEEDASITEGLAKNLPTESLGMAAGGVTTFGHFAGAPGEELVPSLVETIEGLDRYSYVDSFVHAYVLSGESVAHLDEAWRLGITSFKHFYSAYGRRALEDRGLAKLLHPVENDVLLPSMEFVARRGVPGCVMVHAEDGDVVDFYSRRIRESGRNGLDAWSDARPEIAETLRVAQAIELARHTGARLYIPHLTTAAACGLVETARRRGQEVYAETGPQWLTHHAGMEDEIGCWGKVNPPLRTPTDSRGLWEGLRSGAVSCLGTDSGAGGRTAAMKEKGGGKHNNIWAARPGIRGGPEHLLPVMMTYGVHQGRLELTQLVRVAAENTARVFGLYPRKGALVPGADADVLVVDPERRVLVDDSFYRGVCEVSIYSGRELRSGVDTTIVRGKVVMEDGDLIDDPPGHGSYQSRGSIIRNTKREATR